MSLQAADDMCCYVSGGVLEASPRLRFGGSFEFGRVFNPLCLRTPHISLLSNRACVFWVSLSPFSGEFSPFPSLF